MSAAPREHHVGLPDPLVPAQVDLRGYEFMPLHGDVLFRSSFWKRATDAEKLAALRLWWSAWWEVPAGSLPNNERDLAHLAGVDLRRWRALRSVVMEKWVLCSDDRWYLPFLADLALLSFSKRKSLSLRGRIGAAKRWGNNGEKHATANSAGNATAIQTNSPGNATATEKASPKNGKGSRSEVNTPLTPHGGRSTPRPGSKAVERTRAVIDEQRAAAEHAATPPKGKLPSEFLKDFIRTPDPFEPVPRRAPAPPPHEPTDWRTTSESIDHQGDSLGMQRLKLESDDDYASRIQARLNLG